jgi:predicted ATPase
VRLPVPATGLIGREAELAGLVEAVGGTGLVTVTGAPGSGKTRLAVEAVRVVAGTGRPVALVELAPLREEDAVLPALAAATGTDAAAADAVLRCAQSLTGAVLVIDNAEHLIDAVAALVTDLRRHGTGLAVLVTSQRPLLLSGERVHRLGPLSPASAARLFAERAAAGVPGGSPGAPAAGGPTTGTPGEGAAGGTPGIPTGDGQGGTLGGALGGALGNIQGSAGGNAPGNAQGDAPGTAEGPAPGNAQGDAPGTAKGPAPGNAQGDAPGTAGGSAQGARKGDAPGGASGGAQGGAGGTAEGGALGGALGGPVGGGVGAGARADAVMVGGGVPDAAEEGAAVAAVCDAVDRLPLGIELAAGLTRTLSVRQVADRMADRLRLLVGGARDAGPRQESLRAALDWSYGLLPECGQAVLRRLAVFAGGCTLEAAEEVAAGGTVAAADVAPALADLADGCLLVVQPAGSCTWRFGLLETVREYAADRLRAAGEEPVTLAAHLEWCRAVVAAGDVQGADGAADLAALVAEWPNLTAALQRAPGTARAAGALRLALALDAAWTVRGQFRQARRHYAALVDAAGVTVRERAEAAGNYAMATALAGAVTEAVGLLARAAALAGEAGEDELAMRVNYHRGVLEIQRGWPLAAVEPLTAGLALADGLRRERAASAFVDALGSARLYAGEAAAAADLHAAANAYDRAAGYDHGLARGLVNEADALFGAGRPAQAAQQVAAAERIAARLRDRSALAVSALLLGEMAAAAGDAETAAGHLRDAIGHATAAGSDAYATLARTDLADALIQLGDLAAARPLVHAVRTATTDRGLAWLAAQPTEAALALADGDAPRARAVVRAATAEYAARSFGWPQVIARLERVRAALAPPAPS